MQEVVIPTTAVSPDELVRALPGVAVLLEADVLAGLAAAERVTLRRDDSAAGTHTWGRD